MVLIFCVKSPLKILCILYVQSGDLVKHGKLRPDLLIFGNLLKADRSIKLAEANQLVTEWQVAHCQPVGQSASSD